MFLCYLFCPDNTDYLVDKDKNREPEDFHTGETGARDYLSFTL